MSADILITLVLWENATSLLYRQMDRFQQNDYIYRIHPTTGVTTLLVHRSDPAWIDPT